MITPATIAVQSIYMHCTPPMPGPWWDLTAQGPAFTMGVGVGIFSIGVAMVANRAWAAPLLAVALIAAVPTEGAANPAWLNRALSDVGTNPTGWSHKWCARYLDMVVPGGAGPASASWKSYGSPSTARPGAIAVMRGHVGIVGPKGCNGGRCQIVSGNHSGKSGRRTVGLGSYSMGRIISFRWPHQ